MPVLSYLHPLCHAETSQMPPDGVVKFQRIDITKFMLWQHLRASDV